MTDEPLPRGDRTVQGIYRALPGAIEDRLFGLLNALVAEVWTVRSRQHLVEAALAEQGIDVESYFERRGDRSADLAADLEDRDAFIERVYESLLPPAPGGEG